MQHCSYGSCNIGPADFGENLELFLAVIFKCVDEQAVSRVTRFTDSSEEIQMMQFERGSAFSKSTSFLHTLQSGFIISVLSGGEERAGALLWCPFPVRKPFLKVNLRSLNQQI